MNSGKKTANVVLERSYAFALSVIDLYRRLTELREFVLSKQLLRSGTSIGANVEEAQAAQSTKDFISKMAVACKEARESRYWLRLLHQSNLCPLDYMGHLEQAEELVRLLTAIIKTTQERSRGTPIQNS